MGVITEHPKILLTKRVSVVVRLYENKIEKGSLFAIYDQNTKFSTHRAIYKSNKISTMI